MQYQPGHPPNPEDTVGVVDYFSNELKNVAGALQTINNGNFEVQSTPPTKAQQGQLLYADGIGWNPGSGAGWYYYDGSHWIFMGSTSRQNKLINGAFQVWQRGSLIIVNTARTYTADRWLSYRGSFAFGAAVSRQPGEKAWFCARFERIIGNTSIEAVYLLQQIESVNAIPLRGQQVTLQFRARAGSGLTTSGGPTLYSGIVTGTGIDEPNDFSYTNRIENQQFNLLTTNFQDFVQQYTLPANATEIAISFYFIPTGTAPANDYVEIEEVQLVIGQSGPMPYRPLGEEIVLCERYFQSSFPWGVAPASNVGAGANEYYWPALKAGAVSNIGPRVYFRTRMRTSATIVTYNPSSANNQLRDQEVPGDCSSTGVIDNADLGFSWVCVGNAATAIGNRLSANWSADAEI